MFEHLHKPGIHLYPFSPRTVHKCPLHILEGVSLEKNKELDTELGVQPYLVQILGWASTLLLSLS